MPKDVVKITQATYDSISRSYSASVDQTVSGWVGKFEDGLLEEFCAAVSSTSGVSNPRILDIGCGNGKDTASFLKRGLNVLCADISAGMLAEARRRVSNGGIVQLDMRVLPFLDGAFGGIWANGCIYHVPKDELPRVLREALRTLTQAGVFSFNFKVGKGEGIEESPRSHKGGPRFYAYYRPDEMRQQLRDAGFTVLQETPYPSRIFGEDIVQALSARHP